MGVLDVAIRHVGKIMEIRHLLLWRNIISDARTKIDINKKVEGQKFFYESWTKILEVPDWAALEKTWSDGNM